MRNWFDLQHVIIPGCDNDDLITKLRSCIRYTMTMTAYELGGSETEVYQTVYVTTLEGSMYFCVETID